MDDRFVIFYEPLDAVRFVTIADRQKVDINLLVGKTAIDAKSIIAVMGLGIKQKVRLQIVGDESEQRAVAEALSDFLV